MKPLAPTLIAILLLVLPACSLEAVVSPHDAFGVSCSACHVTSGEKTDAALRDTDSRSLCGTCHLDRATGSGEHAVGVPPSEKMPSLPLDGAGLVVCITCHDPHEPLQPSMLRVSPESLCAECHEK